MDGVPLGEVVGGPLDPRLLVAEGVRYGRETKAVRAGRYKLIQHADGSRELYDLDADPFELFPIAAPDVEQQFAIKALAKQMPRFGPADPGRRPPLQVEVVDLVERLTGEDRR